MFEQSFRTLGRVYYLKNRRISDTLAGELSCLLSAIRLASKMVNREVNKAGIATL